MRVSWLWWIINVLLQVSPGSWSMLPGFCRSVERLGEMCDLLDRIAGMRGDAEPSAGDFTRSIRHVVLSAPAAKHNARSAWPDSPLSGPAGK